MVGGHQRYLWRPGPHPWGSGLIGHCWGAGSQVMLCTWSADHPSSILASVWGPLADPCSPLVGPSWAPAVAGTRPGCELASALPEPSAFPRHTSPHVACTPWPPRVACTSWPPTWPLCMASPHGLTAFGSSKSSPASGFLHVLARLPPALFTPGLCTGPLGLGSSLPSTVSYGGSSLDPLPPFSPVPAACFKDG